MKRIQKIITSHGVEVLNLKTKIIPNHINRELINYIASSLDSLIDFYSKETFSNSYLTIEHAENSSETTMTLQTKEVSDAKLVGRKFKHRFGMWTLNEIENEYIIQAVFNLNNFNKKEVVNNINHSKQMES